MEAKKDILIRVYLVYVLVCLLGVAILAQVIKIQFIEGEFWKEQSKQQTLAYRNIEAVRGNIFAADGSLLATSLPNYEIRMDVNADALTDIIFYDNIDSLSLQLSNLFNDKPANEYKRELIKARKNGSRYHLIKRKVTYDELKELRTFALFRLGKYKGGLIYEQRNIRARPFRVLAARTIGYDRPGIQPVGLEGAYENELKGVSGKRLMQKIAGGVWMPVNDENEIEPEDGADLVSTIDINIQDVAEHALLTQLSRHNADHGCVVLMEVSTGHIKAIANLSRNENGEYYERYNYAIGESTEPGSTFKLASLMAAFEDKLFDLNDSVDTENGKIRFYDRIMKDSHEGGYGKISVKRAFEVSSNVAVSKLINQHYAKNPSRFVNRLYNMGLGEPLGIEISGEGSSKIKSPKNKDWYGTTLPWMSIGYELRLTPLQQLAFYNAVANNGKMVKPMFVKEVRKHGKLIKKFEPVVIKDAICSKATIEKAKEMLEGVVENGTATNLKKANVKIAGKTGTAQIANDKYGYKYETKISYQASLAGYFPAGNPKYSCIIVVNAPSSNVYYGNDVAGPIFKEIADKVYSSNLDIHENISVKKQFAQAPPAAKKGNSDDLIAVLNNLNVNTKNNAKSAEWISPKPQGKRIELNEAKIPAGKVPDVTGMGVKDAAFILENKGLIVKIIGRGAVKSQSIRAGEKIEKGSIIILELS